jgi:hypothetical protein
MIYLSLGTKVFWVAVISLLLLHFWRAWQFRNRAARQVKALSKLDSTYPPAQPPTVIHEFALRACPPSQRRPKTIRIHQVGEMRLSKGDSWMPFTAVQDFAVQQPGFVWRATFQAAPRIKVKVIDSYVDGKGYLEARLFGSIPLAKAKGCSADKGELMRYLAELVFCPDALLMSDALQWTERDSFTVEVAAGEGAARAVVCFHFDSAGDVVKIYASDRPRMVDHQAIETPWMGTFSGYKVLDGYRIPTRGEVSWLIDGEICPYWRGHITQLEIDPVADAQPPLQALPHSPLLEA